MLPHLTKILMRKSDPLWDPEPITLIETKADLVDQSIVQEWVFVFQIITFYLSATRTALQSRIKNVSTFYAKQSQISSKHIQSN